jgi:squalene-hopene/tetraprenyl-beta-curcumene cyclase
MTTLPLPTAAATRGDAADLPQRARACADRAVESLFSKQRTDKPLFPGPHWCAELEGDSILSSEYILMKWILAQENEPRERTLLPRITNQLRLSQRPDGTWGQYPGSPADISACVKAYLCLKLAGDDANAPHMRRAREAIIALGGADKCNTFSTFYLACLGIVSWNACPAIPPQIVLLPRWFPFHLSKVAAWTRTMILPLALCSALQPVRKLPNPNIIDELFINPRAKTHLSKPWSQGQPFTWNNFFLLADRGMKLACKLRVTPYRKLSITRAEKWIIERVDPKTTEGLGAIFPPMVYLQIAFKALGYSRDHPLIKQAEHDLDDFMIDEPSNDPKLDHVRLQPCFSPVWDTAIAIDALAEAGVTCARDERLALACDWLRAREVKLRGDHIENFRPEHKHLRPGVDIAMWAFEYRNDWYPDVDDTCMVTRALWRAGDRAGESANRDAANRGVQWILAMQNDDGGWAAFDRTRDRSWMEAIPFADHNAMQDPSCSDITGRVIESLVTCNVEPTHPAIHRGVQYLIQTQQPEGCWWGRWGVNYIYGTWQAINGLMSAGVSREHPSVVRAREWLLSVQSADGGFGESANSYLDRTLMGKGPSTPSQTAWGLITLLHLLGPEHDSCKRAAQYLIDQQLAEDKQAFQQMETVQNRARSVSEGAVSAAAQSINPALDPVRDRAGGWCEHWFTGTGFPKVFYLRYHLYRHSFPLKAIARFAHMSGA